MNFSSLFISRPIATTLLTIGLALAGGTAFFSSPRLADAERRLSDDLGLGLAPRREPRTVSTSVTTPLERHLGAISDVSEMTSSSSVGSSRITLQFGLDRNIDGAARDVQAAINAARVDLPASLAATRPTAR